MQPVMGVLLALAAAVGSGRAPGWATVGLEGAGRAGTGGCSGCRVGQGPPPAPWDMGPVLHTAGVSPLCPHAELLPCCPGHRSPLNDFQRLRATELLAVPADAELRLPERGSAGQCAQRCAASLLCR